jgi:hypothetical protein
MSVVGLSFIYGIQITIISNLANWLHRKGDARFLAQTQIWGVCASGQLKP